MKIPKKTLQAMNMSAKFLEFINIVMMPKISVMWRVPSIEGREEMLRFSKGFEEAVKLITKQCINKRKKLMFIGNGGSAAITSHQALDFFLHLKIDVRTFNDGPFLTCMSNYFGFENIFVKPISVIAQAGDVLVAISSSGKSPNILKAVKIARKKGCFIVTMSGFKPNNLLRKKGNINFYVPSASYRIVEAAHSLYWDFILEMLISRKKA